MKKTVSCLIILSAVLIVMCSGCAKKEALGTFLPDDAVSAKIRGDGQTAEITDPDVVSAFIADVSAIECRKTESSVQAPGRSFVVTLTRADGTEMQWGYPIFELDGAWYACDGDPSVVSILDHYLYD